MKTAVAALTLAALIGSIAPATYAQADCGDPGQDPCTGPAPTVDQVVGIMQQLTDPNIPAATKGSIVTPGFTADEAETIDDHLHQMDGYSLPLNFIVSDIQPAPDKFAGATVATTGANFHSFSRPGSVVLVEDGGHWKLTHDSAISTLNAYWYNANRRVVVVR